MFSSIPDVDDWGDDEDDIKEKKGASSSLSGKASSSLKDTKKKAQTLVRSLSAQMLSAVTKRTDSVFHSPGMSKGLLMEQEGEDEPDGSNKKKKKKKKHKKDKDQEGSATSTSSSSVGSILRQGIRFSGFDDFCSFVDSSKHKDNKKKRKESEMGGSCSSPEAPPPKKKLKMESGGGGEDEVDGSSSSSSKKGAKSGGFDIAKLKSFLGGQKASGSAGKATSNDDGDSKAKSKLKTSRFRYLNELLYTQPGSQSFKMFRGDVDSFRTYHEGYMEQARKWPHDPLQTIITSIVKSSEKNPVIADFGCGEARLALALSSSPKIKVHSFDFVALNDRVTPCDMSRTPLEDETVDVVVFCLSLMGTNLRDYLKEANRVLRMGGILKIAEVESRFQDFSVDQFTEVITRFGFGLKWKEVASKGFFVFMDFNKLSHVKKKAPEISLKPCIYKKR